MAGVRQALILVGLALAGCVGQAEDRPLDFYDPSASGKTDAFGRRLAGIPSDYPAEALDEALLQGDARARREAAWTTVGKVLEQVPLLGLVDAPAGSTEPVLANGEIPKVPRYETWYGIDDVKRIFQHLYEALDPASRAVRTPFDDAAIAEAVKWNATSLDRMSSWPLERYLKYVRELGMCPADLSDEACLERVLENFSGAVGGNTRILYSPGTVDHVLRNYGRILDCLKQLDGLAVSAQPTASDNFSFCFERELPSNSVLVKAQWLRADFGRKVPAFDTDAAALTRLVGGTAQWSDAGDRQRDPSPRDIFTIRLRNGDTYRLVGMHIMTKELRHWQWITLFWSDAADKDFGADRPERVRQLLQPVWSHYKMCVVDGFAEGDADAPGRFADHPDLAEALRAVDRGAGGPTWCSNPYIEHGRGNGRSNCVGCHQHGGSTVAQDLDGDGRLDPLNLEAIITDELHFPDNGRRRIRELFPADYLYSFNHVDDLAGMIAGEVTFFDGADRDAVLSRIQRILGMTGVATAGGATFAERCTPCHGPGGEGSAVAPSLYERVPMRDDTTLLQVLINGRGQMPKWGGVFSDQELADLFAFLRATFGSHD